MADADFLNGVPELLVLQLLDRQPMYGYQLVSAIRVQTSCNLEFGEGCIYPLLHKLKRRGYVTSRRDLVAGRSRVVYRLTSKGNKRLETSASRWQTVVTAIQAVLGTERGLRHAS